MSKFIGRQLEMKKLQQLLLQPVPTPKLIIVKGRRRIGKSRLLQEFGQVVGRMHFFTGLAPGPGVTAQTQRDEFARQLNVEFGVRGIKTEDWGDLFWHLSQQTQEGRVLLVLDEISWMAKDDSTFLSKLQLAWERYFKKNTKIILALCSSISLWIENNLLSSTGFVGRQSLIMTLKELTLPECNQFWEAASGQISPQEKLLMLAVTGGIPRYLEEMNPNISSAENIKNMGFSEEGILFHEFQQIFSDLFGEHKKLYREICETLALGPASAQTIYQRIGKGGTGEDYNHLKNLSLSGFIRKDHQWNPSQEKTSKIASYRLSDNYCRFYLKYIHPNRHKIEQGSYQDIFLTSLPNWSSIIGLQIENIVLNNRHLIKKALNISPTEVLFDNPYIQRATQKREGCQIDYLIQTRFNTLYVCEIKYSKDPLPKSVIKEVQQKISALKVSRNFSIRPVLIHCNTISESIEESGFFANIINFSEFL